MSNLFDEDDLPEDSFEEEQNLNLPKTEKSFLDARRRLEKILEEKRLHDELDDSVDY